MNLLASMVQMNGLGNKIIVIDMRPHQKSITAPLVKKIAQQNHVNFDQLMVLYDAHNNQTSANNPVECRIEIWNHDASKAQACGNGTRCVAAWLHRLGGETEFTFLIHQDRIHAHILETSPHLNGPHETQVEVNMGHPLYDPSSLKLTTIIADTNFVTLESQLTADATFLGQASLVSMGNPHAIFFVEQLIETYDLSSYGRFLEHDPLFSDGANISIAFPTSFTELSLKTWERGVGMTSACGSAACASVVAATRRNLMQKTMPITVTMPGGSLIISWETTNDVIMRGTAEYEFSAYLDLETGEIIKDHH